MQLKLTKPKSTFTHSHSCLLTHLLTHSFIHKFEGVQTKGQSNTQKNWQSNTQVLAVNSSIDLKFKKDIFHLRS